jgi:hypothetical protein
MKWEAEFRASDRRYAALLSGKMGGQFTGTVPDGAWGKIRVAIINGFNEVITNSESSVACLENLPWVGQQITAALAPTLAQLGTSGEVVVEFANLDESSEQLVEERKRSGPAAPDAFLIGVGAQKAGFDPGDKVLVQWSDGNRYPAKVVKKAPDQYLLELGDGRQMWVAAQWVYRT